MTLIQDVIRKDIDIIGGLLDFSINFYHSTPNEFVFALLNAESTNPNGKYPFFFVNSVGIKYSENGVVTIPEIVIATLSDPNWVSTERDLYTFKPILHPICELFVDRTRVGKSRDLALYQHGDIEPMYFYGKSGINGYDGNKFPNSVDAIRLSNFKFRVYSICKK